MTPTQNCAECGTRAEPGQSFCDACGAVLSWSERAGATASAAEGSAARSGAGPAGAGGNPARPSGAAGDGSGGAEARPGEAPHFAAGGPGAGGSGAPTAPASPADGAPATGTPHDASPPLLPHPATPSPAETAPTEPVPAAPADADDRARRLLVPVAEPEPGPTADPAVAPVLPGRPVDPGPQTVRAPGEEPGADGGTPCPWCATRNRPERHYCARCAMPMAGEPERAAVRLPWWRRLLGQGRETPWAGDRPRLRRAFDRVLSWLGAALVLTLLIVLAFQIPKAVEATRDHFAKRAPVAPDSYHASRSYPGHSPKSAFDLRNNTWWGPGVSESGEGQWIEARFKEPTRLLDLVITPGVSARADEIDEQALPHRVQARITTADGKTTTRQLVLDQGAGAQRRAFKVGEVTSVRFTLESAYGTSAKKQVAIAEVEFFGPSKAN